MGVPRVCWGFFRLFRVKGHGEWGRSMGCHRSVAARLWAALACACVFACACGSEVGVLPGTSELVAGAAGSASAQVLPELGCYPATESVGDCGRSADCEDGKRCVFDSAASFVDRAPVPLTCGEPIGTRAALARCTQGSDCQTGLCALTGVCLEPCRHTQDCAEARHCRPVEARFDDALGPVMACVRPLILPDTVALTVSPKDNALSKGVSTVWVPGAMEPSIVFVQGGCGAGLDVLKLHSLDLGRDLYDRLLLQRGQRAENTVLHDGSSLAALIFPNNPALPPSRLGLTLSLGAATRQQAEVVVAARAPGLGVLDLNVFYVGGGADVVDGGFKPGEPRVTSLLTNLDRRLRTLGLSLGRVREHDVVGALREELSVLDVPKRQVGEVQVEGRPQRLDELFRLSAGVDSAGINVFIIREMGDYLGIAGGIPGLLGLHGTDRSGVALAADMLGDLPTGDVVLLHEIGHFVGLFHTTESSGAVLDPLLDTPRCDLTADSNSDHLLSSDECAGHGGENLMFWSGTGTSLTKQQVTVMASSVLFR